MYGNSPYISTNFSALGSRLIHFRGLFFAGMRKRTPKLPPFSSMNYAAAFAPALGAASNFRA